MDMSELAYCLRELSSSKAADRKKSAEKLKALLSKGSVIQALDKHSDSKASSREHLSWYHVLKGVFPYIDIESEALQKGKEAQSATARTNKEKKKQEISGLVKFIIRQADKRGPRLKSSMVLAHISKVLQDDYMCAAYGQDYTNILLKTILTFRKYWTEISSSTWQEFITLYCKKYSDPECTLDKILLSRVIRSLITGAGGQCDLRPKRLLGFFTDVFKNVRQEKTTAVREHLMFAMNVFIANIAENSRVQICSLGEAILVNILYLWNNRPSNSLKDEIIKFLRMQMTAHHPCGVRRQEEGAFAVDWDVWMSHVRKLYEVLYTDLQQLKGRSTRYCGGSRESVLSPEYVDLAADLCNQLFSSNIEAIEVTQQADNSQGGPRAKKRRLESGWAAIRDFLVTAGHTVHMIPWLQLVTRYLEKYPQNFPQEELLPYFNFLSSQITEFKSNEVMQHLLSCIKAFVSNWKYFAAQERESCKSVVMAIWMSALRMVSLHHAVGPGFQLLDSISEQRIIPMDKDIWSLFIPTVSSPCNDSIIFLQNYVLNNKLPENHQSALLAGWGPQGANDQQNKQYLLRIQILNWIIPGKERLSESSISKLVRIDKVKHQAHVLVLLILKNPYTLKKFRRIEESSQHNSSAHFTLIEDLFLQTTGSKSISKLGDSEIPGLNQKIEGGIEIPFLLERLQRALQEDEMYLEVTEANSAHLEDMSHKACLLTYVLYWLLEYRVLSPDSVHTSELAMILKRVLERLGKCMASVIQKEERNVIMKVLPWLLNMLQFDSCNMGIANITAARLCRSLVPAKLIDQLMKLAQEKSRKQTFRANSDMSISSSGRLSRRQVIHEDDDSDFDFDDPPALDQGEESDDDFGESQESEDGNKEEEEFQSILSRSLLSEEQKMRLEAVRTLCSWCGYDQPEMKRTARYEMAVDQDEVKAKVVGVLGQDDFDTTKTFDLQMMKIIIQTLTAQGQYVSDKNLETMIIAVRLAVKDHRQDQGVCCMCLQLLSVLATYLSSDDGLVSKALLDCRDSALRLLYAFWNLYEEGSYCSNVRLSLAKCLMAFIQSDPEREWAVLMVNNSDGDKEDQPTSNEFVKILSDFSHSVRVYGAQAITRLFTCNGIPQDRKRQDEEFNKIYEELMGLLDIQKNLSAERAKDEWTNRTASALCTVGNIICVSPVCEKKALFAFCQLIMECNVETSKVQKIIERVGQELRYKDGRHFVTKHLPYLFHQWLQLKYPVAEFPHKIAFCDTKEAFYRNNYKVIIPEVIMMLKDMDKARVVVSTINMDWLETLKLCVPRIVVHILPLFAATRSAEESHDDQVKKRVSHATACYTLLCNEASKEVVDKIMVSSLDKVVVNILMCLYDPDEDEFMKTEHIRNLDPEPNPPCFNMYSTQSTLDYLKESFGNKRSLVEVLSHTQDAIQKILLELSVNLTREHRLHEKRRIMLMYRLFCKLLLREFQTRLGGSWAYILREILHRLIFIIKDMVQQDRKTTNQDGYTVNIACMALELLRDTCCMAVEVCPEELGKYLMFLVSSLVPVITYSGDIGEQAYRILSLLIVDNTRVLSDAIAVLDPFPDSAVFSQLEQIHSKLRQSKGERSLKQNIEQFLDLDDHSQVSPDNRKEGLRYLAQQLYIHKSEISQLAQYHRGDTSLICRLVSRLVRMGRLANDSEVRLEIGQCLGQIGPVDLGREALPQSESEMLDTIFGDDKLLENYSKIFHMLDQYLTEADMDIVEATSSVLKAMLRTQAGLRFADQYITMDHTDHLLQYLHPFRPKKKSTPAGLPNHHHDADFFIDTVDSSELWTTSDQDHGHWIKNLTCQLIISGAVKDQIMAHLVPICQRKTKFCEFILPLLIHDMLSSGAETHKDVLSKQISDFFMRHCVATSDRERNGIPATSSGGENICLNKDSVRTMLAVVQYLRQQQRPKEGRRETTAWDNNFWLDLNYLHIAKGALFCSAHFSTILYAEIWCNTERLKKENQIKKSSQQSQGVYESFTQDTNIDSLSSDTPAVSINVQDLLLEAYRQIGDPDGLYGCGAGRLVDTTTRVKTYEHEERWDKALLTYDVEMMSSAGDGNVSVGMLQAIQNFGAIHLFGKCLQNVDIETCSPEMRELQYQAAWRTGNWTLDSVISTDSHTGFSEALYCGMHALRDVQLSVTKQAVNMARLTVLDRLRDASIESCRCLYPMLSDLQGVSQLQQVQGYNIRSMESLEELLLLWKGDEEMVKNDFEFVEPTYAIRCGILGLLQQVCPDESITICLQRQLLDLVRSAIDANRHQIAERVIHELKSISTTDLNLHIPKLIEEAKLYWSKNEQNVAKHLMKDLIEQLDRFGDSNMDAAKLYPQVLSFYGNWLAETHSENPNIILEDYLEKTIERIEQLGEDSDMSLDAYVSLARFADNQYQSIVNHMKSSTYEAKQNLMRKAKQEIESYRSSGLARDRYISILEKQSLIDQVEMTNMEEDKVKFLLKAVENYLKCLKSGDKHDLRIFRLMSLWFSNSTIPEVNTLIQGNIRQISSYKFLSLMYQLCARMDVKSRHNQGAVLQETLNQVIEQTAVDHPHHTLFCILALANAKKDEEIFKKPGNTKRTGKLSRSNSEVNPEDEGRIDAAKNLIQRLKSGRSKVADIVNKMERLCEAYIELANFGVKQHRAETKPIPLDKRLRITQISGLTNVAVPTADVKAIFQSYGGCQFYWRKEESNCKHTKAETNSCLQIDRSCDYSDIVTLHKFEPTFKLAGGIHLPKIITCVGSDGVGRRQLVKGEDDLRQDAVMQQVFQMLSNLLQKNKETRKRRLHVRQYKVIPLSQCSGLLEWCEGTLPIGEYLIGGKDEGSGAHCRYRPYDIKAMECRQSMAAQAKSARASTGSKLKVFLDVCSKFQPVFRYFFIEKFPHPSLWFERRLAYTKSVATTSIVGYILGLGDRHVGNILVDVNTAELIHIDLGIAFEQGRILPTPETVPFRLTRDIVDGMGISGVEGVFRRCCEKTMEVMHNNQEALLTILEVLLYDPLNNWTMSPQKACALQNRRERNDVDASELNTTRDMLDAASAGGSTDETQESVNKLAERVLLRLQQKLQGIEDGVQLSVAGQVNHLIQEARDPKNLSRLFAGWQPYI